jgi:DNA mismatch repair protein, C-terminal domain
VDLPDISKVINAHMRSYFRGHFPSFPRSRMYPFVFFHVEVDPSEVDVNFTAEKRKCRFTRAEKVMDVVSEILEQGYELAPEPEPEPETKPEPEQSESAPVRLQPYVDPRSHSDDVAFVASSQSSSGRSAVSGSQPQIDSLFASSQASELPMSGSKRKASDPVVSSHGSTQRVQAPVATKHALDVSLDEIRLQNRAIDDTPTPLIPNGTLLGQPRVAELSGLVMFQASRGLSLFSPSRCQERLLLLDPTSQLPDVDFDVPLGSTDFSPSLWARLGDDSSVGELLRFGLVVEGWSPASATVRVSTEMYPDATNRTVHVIEDVSEALERLISESGIDVAWRPVNQRQRFWQDEVWAPCGAVISQPWRLTVVLPFSLFFFLVVWPGREDHEICGSNHAAWAEAVGARQYAEKSSSRVPVRPRARLHVRVCPWQARLFVGAPWPGFVALFVPCGSNKSKKERRWVAMHATY